MIQISGYDIQEQIFSGKCSNVFRGLKRDTKQKVVIKIHSVDYPTHLETNRLRHDFEIGRQFNHERIVRYLTLETCQQRLAIIEEDFGATSLADLRSLLA